MGLVSELRRRNVLRMAVLYVVAAWLIMQVAEVIIGLANLPEWIGPTTLGLLAVGFPIALILSWFYELTAEGISLERDVAAAESIKHVTGRRMDFIVISLLCAAVVLFAYDKWWIGPPPEKSIAVLAFENMSADPDQEYFSDGISEEILNLLAEIPELRVISRSSSFSFKGKDIAIPTVAEQLNVAHVLEGSVRKAGNRVRITAQLIEARSDLHLWSETYDRTLEDIFSIQAEIANAVVDELRVTLLGQHHQTNETDPEAYTLYLQARHLAGTNTVESLQKAIALYRQVLEVDPQYSPAWLGLGVVYERLAALRFLPLDEAQALSFEAVERAANIAPNSAKAQGDLAWRLFTHFGEAQTAAHHFERALMLEPSNTNIIGNISIFLTSLGRVEDGIQFAEYQVSRDPANAVAYNNLGIRYRYAGRTEKAIDAFSTCLTLNPSFNGAHYELGATLLAQGEHDAAAIAFESERLQVFSQVGMSMVYHSRGEAGRSQELLDKLIASYGDGIAYYVASIMAYKGDIDSAFEWLERAHLANDYELSDVMNEPLLSNLHSDSRWMPFLEDVGSSPAQLAAIQFNVSLPK
jgi:adenylate cyclase